MYQYNNRLYQGAQLLHAFGFCPPAKWQDSVPGGGIDGEESLGGHTECSFKNKDPKSPWIIPRTSEFGTFDVGVQPDYEAGLPEGVNDGDKIQEEPTTNYGWTIKFAIPDAYHKGKDPFGQHAIFNDGDYSKPDEVDKKWAKKKIKVNDPPEGITVAGSAVIFAFFKPYAANQANNVNPYYMEAVTNRGILEDGSKWWWLGDGDRTYSVPYHGPGDLKSSLQADLEDKWGGVYEQPRGAVCMWSTSVGSELKLPEVDMKRVFIVDKNGDVKVLKDAQDGDKGLVGGGENPLQADPCA